MAIYTYRCSHCGEKFEAKQSVKDDPLTDCILCDQIDAVKRIIVPGTSFRIGGLGVYNPTSMYNNSDDRGPGR